MVQLLDGLNMTGALPTIFDNSLSPYELLTKILNKLEECITGQNALDIKSNKDITDFKTAINTGIASFESTTNTTVQEYITAYNTLKAYVDNYFVNLNLQNEINTKLNSMNTDGTLSAIINTQIFGDINLQLSKKVDYPILAVETDKVINVKYPYGDVRRYGAYGDNTHDDTVSFQNAISTGLNIIIPNNKGEVYKITTTLTVNTKGQNIAGTSNHLYNKTIMFSSTVNDIPIFECKQDGIQIENLSFYAGNFTITGIKSYCLVDGIKTPDNDSTFHNLYFYNMKTGIEGYGRGIFITDCSFDATITGISLFWGDETRSDLTTNTVIPYGYRAIRILNNRFHAGTNQSSYAIELNGGTSISLFGAIIEDNLCDWRYSFLKVSVGMKDCRVANNTILHCCDVPIVFTSTSKIDNLLIINNVFEGSNTTLVAGNNVNTIITIANECTIDGLTIRNNIFRCFYQCYAPIFFGSEYSNPKIIKRVNFSDNAFEDITLVDSNITIRGLIGGVYNLTECTFSNNFLFSGSNIPAFISEATSVSSPKCQWINCYMLNNHLFGITLLNTVNLDDTHLTKTGGLYQ